MHGKENLNLCCGTGKRSCWNVKNVASMGATTAWVILFCNRHVLFMLCFCTNMQHPVLLVLAKHFLGQRPVLLDLA